VATRLVYGANGLDSIVTPSVVSGGSARATTLIVDASHVLRSWTDPDQVTTRFGYDTNLRLDSLTDRNGYTTTYGYEPIAWKLTTLLPPALGIDASGTGIPVTTPRRITHVPWQTVGVATAATTGNPFTPSRSDTIHGQIIDAAGRRQIFTVDQWGQPLTTVGATGLTTTLARDSLGYLQSATYPEGQTDYTTYQHGQVTSTEPYGRDAVNYSYGSYAQLHLISGPTQPTTTLYLGWRGHVDSAALTSSPSKAYHYADARGRDTLMIDLLGHMTRYRFDPVTGNQDSVISVPSGRFTATIFDRYGRDSVHIASGANSAQGGVVSRVVYDPMNRLVAQYDALHTTPVTYVYDGIRQIYRIGVQRDTFATTYNAAGSLLTQSDPAHRTRSVTYNAFGLRSTVTNRRGQRTVFRYDSVGHATSIHRPAVVANETDTLTVFWQDVYGDILTSRNGVAAETVYVNHMNRWRDSAIVVLNGNRRFKRTYVHDTRGRTISTAVATMNVADVDFAARSQYWDAQTALLDSVNLKTSGTTSVSATVGMRYNAEFTADSTIFPGDLVRTDLLSNTHTVLASQWSNATIGAAFNRTYAYDSTDRMVEQDFGDGTSELFGYNVLSQLTSRELGQWSDTTTSCYKDSFNDYICHFSQAFAARDSTHYGYDAGGSLDTVRTNGVDTIGTTIAGDRLATWGGQTVSSDSDGNRLSMTGANGTKSHLWSANGRLLRVIAGSDTVQYDYDVHGLLVRRTTNGRVDRYFLWDGSQLLAELDSTADHRVGEYVYLPNATDRPLARITGSPGADTIDYAVQDAGNNVIGWFSSPAGLLAVPSVQQSFRYEPWGTATTISGPATDSSRLRWKGLLYEGRTALYYVRARWYDPVTRRFISADPLGTDAGMNQFAYAGGNPVTGLDPSGKCETDPGEGDDEGKAVSSVRCDGGGEDPVDPGTTDPCTMFSSDCPSTDSSTTNPDTNPDEPQGPIAQDSTTSSCYGFSPSQCSAISQAIQNLVNSDDPVCAFYGQVAANAWANGSIVHITDQMASSDFHVDPATTDAITVFNQGYNYNPATGAYNDSPTSETYVLNTDFDMRLGQSVSNTIAHEMSHYIGLDGPTAAAHGPGTGVDDSTGGLGGSGSYAYQVGSECSGS
jgi:RHS repeat-associated protein